jgi:ribosomal protein L35AE/L33A
LSDADAILSVAEIQSQDSGLLGSELGVPITNISPGTSVGGSGVTLVLSERWVDLGSEADFAVGAGVMVVDKNDSEGRVVCGTITSLTNSAGNGASLVVDFDTTAVTFGSGSATEIAAIPALVYKIIEPGGGTTDRFQLRRNGVLVANDVEDMQLVLFFDDDDDGVVEAGEVEGDDGSMVGDGVSIIHSPALADGRTLKQVRVNLIMSTEREDPDQRAPLSQPQITGNRDPSSVAAPDRKKRRVYQSTIRLRNV